MNLKMTAIVASGLTIIISSVMAAEQTAIIKKWGDADQICTSSGPLSKIGPACDRRESYVKQLESLGWCYGESSQASYQYRWHKCKASSNRSEPIASSSEPSRPSVDNAKMEQSYDTKLKGRWAEIDKTCKQAKELEADFFYNGSKFVALEKDCIVLSSSEKARNVTLRMLCVFEAGEKGKVTQEVKFIDDRTVFTDNSKYRKCADI